MQLHYSYKRPLASASSLGGHSGYSIFLITMCLAAFYAVYGWGPFADLERKVKEREAGLVISKGLKQPIKVDVAWAEGGPEHKFWPEDPNCKNLVTRFAKVHTLATRALVSYPGSGNTWIRYLIEGATGLYTGSIFNDKSILRAGHAGEGRRYTDGSTILQKTHHRSLYVSSYRHYGLPWRKEHISTFKGRAVVVVRNPYKAILSYWNFFNTKSHTRVIAETSFGSQKFQDFVSTGAERWLEVIQDWTSYGKELHFIFYERLCDDPVHEMRQLLAHLGLEVAEDRMACITSHLAGSFKRSKHASKDPFSPEQHNIIRAAIKRGAKLIKDHGGGDLPVDRYEFYSDLF